MLSTLRNIAIVSIIECDSPAVVAPIACAEIDAAEEPDKS